MNTSEAILKMNQIAVKRGFQITQPAVYGNISRHIENGVKVQNVTRTYEKSDGEKLILSFDAEKQQIYY